MSAGKRFPLHYQIFAALVLGTVIGLVVNPRDSKLEDARLTIAPKKRDLKAQSPHVGGDEAVTLTETDRRGATIFAESFKNEKAFEDRYKEASQLYLKNDPRKPVTVAVVERRVHFTEVVQDITIRYTRTYDGRHKIIHQLKAADAKELATKFPQFQSQYEAYAETLSRPVTIAARFIGDLFLRLLRMITIPLIVTSLVTGVAGLGSSSRIGSMFGKTMLYYLATSLLAITTGIVLVNVIQPGIGAELPGGGGGAIAGGDETLGGIFTGLLDKMIPTNPIQSLANGDFLAIITFSILVGLFIITVGGKSGQRMREFFKAGFDVMMAMTMFIIKLAPLGVFAFILYATASQGLDVFKTFALYMLTVFLALAFHAVVVLPLILFFVARRNPLKFAQAMSPALLTAFSTASSNGTLPLTITSVEERAGVSNRVSSFVLPLGATINMDGTALYEVVAVLFIAQAYYGGVMPMDQQILVAFTALLASIGAAGIPSAGLVMMAIVLQAVKLPLDAQGLIIAVDRVLDMCRTSVNVWSDSCGCAVLDRFEEKGVAEGGEPRAESGGLRAEG